MFRCIIPSVWLVPVKVHSNLSGSKEHQNEEVSVAKKRNSVSYPWHDWMTPGGQFRKIVRGKDFAVKPHSMAQMIRNRASFERMRASISIGESWVTFRIIELKGDY